MAPLTPPEGMWHRPEVRRALRERDMTALLRAVQQFTGASQTRLAVAMGMLQGRVSEIVRGRRLVTALSSFERVAAGLDMPDEARMLLGLAPLHPAGLDHLGPAGRAEILAVYPSQSRARKEIDRRAAHAGEIGVVAVRGLGIIGLNDSLLRGHARSAARTRVLLLDPDGDVAHRRAEEIGERTEPDSPTDRLTGDE